MLSEIAAFTTICGLLSAFLSVLVIAARTWVIPQKTETMVWQSIEIGVLIAALATGVLGCWVAMSGQWEYVWQAVWLTAGLALVGFVAISYILGRLHQYRDLKRSKSTASDVSDQRQT